MVSIMNLKQNALILAVFLTSLLPFGVGADDNNARFVKLDMEAREMPRDSLNWVMVKDNKTGLIWEVKTLDDSIHNMDNLYSWKKSKSIFIKQLNQANFGGFSDWRLPEEDELGSILDRNKEAPYIDEAFFPNTAPEIYMGWALCGDGESINSAKIYFGDPQEDEKKKKQRQVRVRAVRGKMAEK